MKTTLIRIASFLSLVFILITFFIMPYDTFAADYGYIEQSLYIWRLVNDVRHNPAQALSSLGIDINALREHLGDESRILDTPLPPLAINLKLYDAAEQHNKNMIDNVYIDFSSSYDIQALESRITSTGYNPRNVGESIGVLAFDTYKDAFDSAKLILINMIKDELLSDSPRSYKIFSNIFTEIGISMRAGNELEVGNSIAKRAYVMVMDFGLPVEQRSYIIGNTLKFRSDNGLFDPKSAVGGVALLLHDINKNIDQSSFSTPVLGAFQFLKYSSGNYVILKAFNEDNSLNTLKIFKTVKGNELYDLGIDDYRSSVSQNESTP